MRWAGNIKTWLQGTAKSYYYFGLAHVNKFRLEERRKVKGAAYYERKQHIKKQRDQAKKDAKVDSKVKTQLAEYGY